ncbi:MAG: metallophosphoesterase family protein [Bacteroidetes bacterium]|nr:MAG: metallophosphoesterase family protein [Bacteroidota bacterium]
MKKIILIILLIAAAVASQAKILMTPYLQSVTTNSVYVMVECDTRDTVWVDYGRTAIYGRSAATSFIVPTLAKMPTYIHKIQLTGLKPNSAYYYQARQGTTQSDGSNFHTAVEPGTSFRLLFMADFRTNTSIHDKIAKLAADTYPQVAIYGGDLCVNGEYTSWKKEFFRSPELDLISKVPFFNATGNHEGNGPNTKAFLQNPESASQSQQYYSFDYGDLHVLVLNTQIDMRPGSPQYEFAKEDLAISSTSWKMVVSHIPAYCAGGHGDDTSMVRMTKEIFEPNQVDLVLSGHSHFYEHNLVNGIHHLVIGSVGAPLYKPEKAAYTLVAMMDYCWAVLDVKYSRLTVTVYNAKNQKLDTVDLKK